MKNKMTSELKAFTEKVQAVMHDLYEEYNSLDEGVEYECPLTRLIDDGESVACMDPEDVLNEEKL